MANISRRNFAKLAGTAATAGLAGCSNGGKGDNGNGGGGNGGNGSGGNGGGGSSSGERPLKWIAPAWAARKQQAQQWNDLTGTELQITNAANPAVVQKVIGGLHNTYDIASHDTISGPAFTMKNPVTYPLSLDKLPKWSKENMSSQFTDPKKAFSKLGSQVDFLEKTLWEDPSKKQALRQPPHLFNYNAAAFNPKYVDHSGGLSNKKWSILYDQKYKGKSTINNIPSIANIIALSHMKDNNMVNLPMGQLNNPQKSAIDKAIDFLVKKKKGGQFRTTWTQAGQSVNIFASEEAVVADLWQPAVYFVRRNGTQCMYSSMTSGVQGNFYWWGMIVPLKPGAKKRNNIDAAAKLLNDVHWSAWFPGFTAQYGYNSPIYPMTDLLREGKGAKVGSGMGPEYYDWTYKGKKTYQSVDKPFLFDPKAYEWADKEGTPDKGGKPRDGGSIQNRIDNTAIFWRNPAHADYMRQNWKAFKTA